VEGLQLLGHDVYALIPGTNYVIKGYTCEPLDLFIQFIAGGGPMRGVRSVMVWGEDSHQGLDDVFTRGFDEVFVRDHAGGPGVPINFGIETRYLCATERGLKPLSEREINICFLGDLAGYKGNRIKFTEKLKQDFKNYNLELGPRKYQEPDAQWSQWTKPWCAHDPRYFETLANSKICLSFKGAGPDTGRTWESLASGAVCLVENPTPAYILPPNPENTRWFITYNELARQIDDVLSHLDYWQTGQQAAWQSNIEHHSTKARAAYFLERLGH
jgi:hypothetical protein